MYEKTEKKLLQLLRALHVEKRCTQVEKKLTQTHSHFVYEKGYTELYLFLVIASTQYNEQHNEEATIRNLTKFNYAFLVEQKEEITFLLFVFYSFFFVCSCEPINWKSLGLCFVLLFFCTLSKLDELFFRSEIECNLMSCTNLVHKFRFIISDCTKKQRKNCLWSIYAWLEISIYSHIQCSSFSLVRCRHKLFFVRWKKDCLFN